MDISSIIALLGGVALFLFGMSLMGEGLKKVAGNKLEIILWKLTSNPIKGVLLGTAVTAVIQSSSATTVMVVGFVNSGMMKVAQAIGIIMGANIGTSITGWILCLSYIDGSSSSIASLLSTATLSAFIALIGIILRMFSKNMTKKHVGEIMLGFSVLMYGMQSMSAAVSPLKESAGFTSLLTKFSNPLLGILIGICITAILQSASASVGILQALTITGAVDFATALPIIMGMGIGAAAPVLLSAIGANTNGKRTAFIYLFNDLFGTIIWAVIFYSVNAIVHFNFMNMTMTPVSIALINTLFRAATIMALLPFIKYLEKLVCWLFKDNPEDLEEVADIDRLEERFIEHPALAIEQSKIALNSMAEVARKNFFRSMNLLTEYSDEKFKKVQQKEDIIDRYEDKLGTYLIKITAAEMQEEQSREISLILHTLGDFERIGDHAVNISEVAKEIHDKKLRFSHEAKNELEVISRAINDILNMTFTSFEEGNIEEAYKVEPLEELIDVLADELKLRHVTRVQNGNCTLNQGFVFNDMINNYERVADHCSNIAVAMIELKTSSFDTHEYLNSVRTTRGSEFNLHFEEYKNKYSI
ncbi:MAG: Na/Pi cotransporter family protein [Eubacterium sp.]